MVEDDLNRIERELQIALPEAYRHLMVNFPVPALAGNTDSGLSDNADQLIKDNQEMRGATWWLPLEWPEYFYCLGVDGGGSSHALDLRGPDGPVIWADRCHLDPDDPTAQPFSKWAAQQVADLRFDLEANGYSPDWTPQELKRAQDRDMSSGCKAVVVFIIVTVAVVVGAYAAILFIWF